MRRPPTHRRDDRGAILFIALVVLLALTGIGLVAMQGATNDLDLTGNARVGQVARNVASSGAEGTMTFAGLNPSAFNQFIAAKQSQLEAAGVPGTPSLDMTDLSGAFYDMATDGSGSFGRDAIAANSATWSSRMVAVLTTHRAPGFQVGEYCFRRYITQTDGSYVNDPAAAARMRIDRDAQARSMVTLFVGPVACP